MATDAMQVENHGDNSVHIFDPSVFWLGIVGIVFGVGLGTATVALLRQPKGLRPAGFLLCVLVSLGFTALSINLCRYRGRTLHITDDGISIQDRHGKQIESLHWIELGRVTERRRFGQLVLWDKLDIRRVFVDQQYKNYRVIRSRILAEYARTFVPKTRPMTFSPDPPLLESFILILGIAICSWGALSTYEQRDPIVSVGFTFFVLLGLVSLLKLHPQLRGPSTLFEDRLVLRGFFKTDEITRNQVKDIQIRDMSNQSGQLFSVVIIQRIDGGELKINSKYGSIPEIYLSLRAWLARQPGSVHTADVLTGNSERPRLPRLTRMLFGFLMLGMIIFGLPAGFLIHRQRPVSLYLGAASWLCLFAMLTLTTPKDRAYALQLQKFVLIALVCIEIGMVGLFWKFRVSLPGFSSAALVAGFILCIGAITALVLMRRRMPRT